LVALNSFASTTSTPATEADSPVVMGLDGRPASPTTAAAASTPPAEVRGSSTDAVAGPESTASVTTGSAPSAAVSAPTAAAPTAAARATEAAPDTTTAPPAGAAASTPPRQAPAPAAVPAVPSVEDQVLALVNVQRAADDCGALTGDAALASVARAHSADMRDRRFFDHVNPDGLSPFTRAERAGLSARAENIAYGQPDAAAVVKTWMDSPGHRANILNCSLTRLGVGVAEGPGGPWWTQLFG
jgi:uncharacterized protein YkwD